MKKAAIKDISEIALQLEKTVYASYEDVEELSTPLKNAYKVLYILSYSGFINNIERRIGLPTTDFHLDRRFDKTSNKSLKVDCEEWEMNLCNNIKDYLMHCSLFEDFSENELTVNGSDEEIGDICIELVEEYESSHPEEETEDSETESEDYFLDALMEIQCILADMCHQKELKESDEAVVRSAANIMIEHLVPELTVAGLLDNPNFLFDLVRLVYIVSASHSYCSVDCYKSRKLYEYIKKEQVPLEMKNSMRFLDVVQDGITISGLVLSEKTETAYLYVSNDTWTEEESYGYKNVFRQSMAMLKLLEKLNNEE